jgi:hypothetical protein
MNMKVPSFNPGASFVPSRPFVPSSSSSGGMNMGAATFQPQAAKPVEPPKEKYVLMIERIVKGSDSDVKAD